MKKLVALLFALAVLAACAPPTPQVIEKEVVVEKKVVETVVVEKEVVVEKKVVETVIVEKEVVVEKVVTPTPVPKPAVFALAADWEPPPAYNGNPFTPIGSKACYWFVYDPLFPYMPAPGAEEMRPRLGLSFEDAKEAFTVKLREGVTWHDGTPFTSKDVWSTFMIGYLKKWPVWMYLKAVETPDDYTVVLRWEKSTPLAGRLVVGDPILWPYHLYGKFADRIDTSVDQGEEPNASVTKELLEFKPELPVGTNAFMMKKPPTASEMILVKNPDHWAADKVDFDQVKILNKYHRNEPWWAYFIAGEIDAGHPATPKDLTEQILAMQPGMEIAMPTDFGGFCLAFNLRKAPFNELKFRQAIAYALDKEKLAEVTYWAGLPSPKYATTLLPSMQEPWLPSEFLAGLTDYSYNPEKAAALLEELGYRKGDDGIWEDAAGKDLSFELVCHAGYSDWVLAIDNIASQLKEFGILIEPITRPGAVYWTSIRAGEYDMCMEWGMQWGSRYAHPWGGFHRTLHPDGDTAKTVDITAIDLVGPEGVPVDAVALIEELGTEFDLDKQKELVQELAWIHNENLPVIPFVEKRIMVFHNEGVRVTGWPPLDDSIWYVAPGGCERPYLQLMIEGVIKAVR